MSARERDYYQQMSGFVAQNGGNVREWAEDFLSTNAIANTLGISRESVYEIKPALINEALGEVENTKLTFSTAGSIINAFKQGERQQELAEYKSNYRNLKANGYTDDDPLVKQAISNINKASNDYEFHKDKSNRFFLTTWTQNAIEQIPYMAEGSIPKLTLSLLGGLLGGGAGATIGGALGQFLASSNYYDQFSGDAFWNMKNSGISTETALKYSTLDGITNALNESFLDVLTGQLAGGVGKLTGLSISLPSTAIMKKVVNNGSWTNLISNFLIYLGMDAGGEFVQESTQSLTSSAFLALAEWEEDKNYSQSVRDALGDALQEGLQGFLTGLFFGLPTSGLNIYADFKTATELKNKAIRTPSKEAFVKNDKNRAAVANFKTGDSDISAETTDEVLTNLWDNTQDARKELRDNVRKELVSDLNLEDDMYLNKAKIYDGEIRNKDGEVISGRNKEVRRKDDGSLYFIIEKNEEKNIDSNTGHYTMKVANPNVVGTNDNAEFLVDASIPDVSDDSSTTVKEEYKELASSPEAIAIEQAGKIEFAINDENHTVTITNVEMQSDDKALKKDAVKELSSMYPDYDISWENMSETDREVYNEIDIENPRNTATETFGLNYVEREYDTEDKAYVRRWLGNYFSDDNAENDFMSLIVLGSAKRLGLTGKAFIERYLNAIQFDESGNTNVKGYTTVEEINGQIKATIYAGINADPTTFLHELHHTIMLVGDNMGRFCNVYQKVKNTERFKKFLRRNADIFKSTILCKRDSEGKIVKSEKGEYQIDESKLEDLFQNKEKWSVEEFEVEARLYEAYMRSGQTLNSEMKGFFNRVADVFRSVYRALRNGIGDVRLNDEIIEYYDSLYGFNSETEREADTSIHLNRISRLNQEEKNSKLGVYERLKAKYRNVFSNEASYGKQHATAEEEKTIKEIVYEYPKAKVADGVLMLDGLKNDRHDMPMQKEFLTAQIVSRLLGQDIILLPRYMDRMLDDIAGFKRFDNYSLSDGITGIVSDGRTMEFKMCSFRNVEANAKNALNKADIAVIVTYAKNGLNSISKKNVSSRGLVYLINSFVDNGVEIMQKNNLSNEWREVCSDAISQLRTDNSIPVINIIKEFENVNIENQDPMDYEVYSRAMNDNVQRLNQEEDDMVIKAKMFNEYSKPEHYEQLKDNPNVYLYKGMDKKKSNLENEKKDAEVLASWGESVYILPDVLVLNGIKYNGLPDAIIGNYFVEFKNTETYSSGTIEERIGNGIKKSDIIFFYVENKMNYPFKDVVKIYRDAIEGKIDSKKDINPEGKIVIIYDGKSKENETFKIKSGPSHPKNGNDIAQSNIQSETQNSQGKKYTFENISFDKVLENAKKDTYFRAVPAANDNSSSGGKSKKNSSEILFQTADREQMEKAREQIKTIKDLYAAGEKDIEYCKKQINEMANETDSLFSYQRKTLKDKPRTKDKIDKDYSGNPRKLKDLFGGTIVFDTEEEVEEAFEKLSSARSLYVYDKKSFAELPSGYRDAKINLYAPHGTVYEVILIEEYIDTIKNGVMENGERISKGIGHLLYEITRQLVDKDIEKLLPEGKQLTLDEKKLIHDIKRELEDVQHELYTNPQFNGNLLSQSIENAFSLVIKADPSGIPLSIGNEVISLRDFMSSATLSELQVSLSHAIKYAGQLESSKTQTSKSANLSKSSSLISSDNQAETLTSQEQKLEKSLTLKQVGDDEWTERAREIALNSTSIEDFFSKYRENVDFNGAELDDNNIRLLISDIFYDTRENVIDEDVDEYYYSEEDVEEDIAVDSFNVETEENVMPDDWLNDTEEEAVNSETDTETDVNTMPDDWLSDEEEETVQEVENSVFEVQKVVVDSELKESSLSNPKMIDKNTKPIEFAAIIAKDKKAAISFLQKLREINREFFYNEAEDSTSDEDREVRRTAYKDIADENIAPFIRNLVLETKNSKLGDLNELSDRAWHIVSGMINANPEFYMDLYARASNNYAWSSNINDNISKVKAELGLTDSEWNSLSFTKRRELALAVKDKELRDKILKGTAEQEEIEDYIKRMLEVKERQLRLAKEKQAKEGVFAYKNTISKPYKDIKKYQEYKYYKIVQAIDYKELKKEINALKEKEGYHCIGGICSAGIYLYVLMGKEKVVNQGRLIRKFERRIDVVEFRNGKAAHLYYGIEETAYAFHCSPELIKGLIYTGQPFPYENDIVTFDLAPNCKYHIEPKKYFR